MIECKLFLLEGADWDWTPPPESGESIDPSNEASDKHLWLFNIADDPEEKKDVSATATYDDGSLVVDDLLEKLKKYYESSKFSPVIWPRIDENYDPADYQGVWEPWGANDVDVNAIKNNNNNNLIEIDNINNDENNKCSDNKTATLKQNETFIFLIIIWCYISI